MDLSVNGSLNQVPNSSPSISKGASDPHQHQVQTKKAEETAGASLNQVAEKIFSELGLTASDIPSLNNKNNISNIV